MRPNPLYLFLSLLFSVLTLASKAQVQNNDIQLIEKQNFINSEYENQEIKFMLGKSKNIFIKYNPVNIAFGSLMYIYQKYISFQISSGCSYEISCSNFSKSAIKEFGIIKGVALTADRLSRCSPLSARDLSEINIDFKKGKVKDDIGQYYFKKR